MVWWEGRRGEVGVEVIGVGGVGEGVKRLVLSEGQIGRRWWWERCCRMGWKWERSRIIIHSTLQTRLGAVAFAASTVSYYNTLPCSSPVQS